MRTANGTVRAETGVVDRLDLGGIEASNLKVVISPALGTIDVLGMNFLSQLASWRVEGRTLILIPHKAAPSDTSPNEVEYDGSGSVTTRSAEARKGKEGD